MLSLIVASIEKKLVLVAGMNNINLPVSIPDGIYIMHISGTDFSEVRKFMK